VKWLQALINRFIRRIIPVEVQKPQRTTISEWISAIDIVVPMIQAARAEFDPAKLQRYDLDLFETNSYLYQVDRLVIKVREYVLALRYHETQFASQPEILSRVEFINTSQACLDCYNTIVNLVLLFKRLPKNKLLSNEFVSQIQALELECSSLRSSIRALNQFVTQYEAKLQMNQLEKSIIQSIEQSRALYEKEFRNKPMMPVIADPSLIYSSSEKLRQKAGEVTQAQDHKLLLSMVNAYDMLRKCYVVARKNVIKETLDSLYVNIEKLIEGFTSNEIHKEQIFACLYIIFNKIESLRFSTNRESRCSRNLFDKAKQIRHQLRKACFAHPIAREFLDEITISRETLLKDNKVSK
jgi:hypothetical protein